MEVALRVRRRRPASLLLYVGAAVGVVGAAILIGWALWTVPQSLYSYVPEPKDRASAEAATRTGMIAGLAGVTALGGLALTSRTYRLTQQGQLTERYTKAIAQLGDEKLDVRLGGIYALERLAADSAGRDQATIVEVLSVFARLHSNPQYRQQLPMAIAESIAAGLQGLYLDVQAAVSVLARLPNRIRVSRADLTGAFLAAAELRAADLRGADLMRVDLHWAHLQFADLSAADLRGVDLSGAHLEGADLSGADLRKAIWNNDPIGQPANLSGADLRAVDLRKARLTGANLGDADLRAADLTGAELSGVDLTDVRWDGSTAWPAGVAGAILAASSSMSSGGYRVQHAYRVPADNGAEPAADD